MEQKFEFFFLFFSSLGEESRIESRNFTQASRCKEVRKLVAIIKFLPKPPKEMFNQLAVNFFLETCRHAFSRPTENPASFQWFFANGVKRDIIGGTWRKFDEFHESLATPRRSKFSRNFFSSSSDFSRLRRIRFQFSPRLRSFNSEFSEQMIRTRSFSFFSRSLENIFKVGFGVEIFPRGKRRDNWRGEGNGGTRRKVDGQSKGRPQ